MKSNRYQSDGPPGRDTWGALRLAGTYVVLGVAWILLTDRAIAWYAADSSWTMLGLSQLKGWFFVGATTVLLFAATRTWELRMTRAYAELAEVARRDRTFFLANPLPMWVYDRSTRRLLDVNEASTAAYGYTRAEFLTMTLDDLRPPAALGETPGPHPEPAAGWAEEAGPAVHRRKDGVCLEVDLVSEALCFGDQPAWLMAVRDLTEVRKAERAATTAESIHHHVLADLADVVWQRDVATGRDVYVNPAALAVYGHAPEAFLRDPELRLRAVHPEDLGIARALAQRAAEGSSAEAEYRILRPDGSVRWLSERITVAVDPHLGTPIRVVGIATDVTDRRESEREMTLAAQVFEGAREGIMVTDADQRILRVNPSFSAITGYAAEEVVGQSPGILASGRHDASYYRQLWAKLARDGHWEGEIWNKRKSGETYAEWLAITALSDAEGRITHYVGIFSDLTERKRAEAAIHRLAWYDVLTALPNRGLAIDRMEQAIAAAQASGGAIALLCVDVDRLKLVNDSLGHAMGDTVLREVARRLTRRVRQSDTVFRGSGAQFLILLTDVHDESEVDAIGCRVLDELRSPFVTASTELRLTASIGAALYPRDGRDPATLVQNAEAALYQAKSLGRDQRQFFSPELNSALVLRLQLENRLRVALERQEFELHYQPQVSLLTGEAVGVEALVRWRHPVEGLVPPSHFIPVAEECGLIMPLGEWVLREACTQAARWDRLGSAPIRVAVNISALQFRQPDFCGTVARVLEETGLPPSRLELELTESIVMDGAETVLRTLKGLKALGVELSLDDFGTGYSSLAYLRRFPLDKLKIDRSFVSNALRDPGDAAIALAVIGIAKRLGLRVIAEGVETPDQACFLRDHGCEEAQGYLYARPLPLADLESWWAARLAA